MIEQSDKAGVIYVCNPNNPTGTVTSRESIEYLLTHKPKEAIVIVDEAYIHYSDAVSSIPLVARDKDVIVLRTFSKIYGMAGLRAVWPWVVRSCLPDCAISGGYYCLSRPLWRQRLA